MDIEEKFRSELERVKGVLEGAGIPWAVAAGTAVYLHVADRPPTDLDLVVRSEDLRRVGDLLGSAPKRVEMGWGDLEKIEIGGTEIAGDLTVRVGARAYSFRMDEEMLAHVRPATLAGLPVLVLAPEDLVALKAVLQRGPEQGKHDLEDVAALAALPMDRAYLRLRLRRMGAEERAGPVLRVSGIRC